MEGTFDLTGSYEYFQGSKSLVDMAGAMAFGFDGSFRAEFYDLKFGGLENFFEGRIYEQNGMYHLFFLNTTQEIQLQNDIYFKELSYNLWKDSNSLEGKYVGEWGLLPKKIEFSEEFGMFFSRVHGGISPIGGSMELDIYKRSSRNL